MSKNISKNKSIRVVVAMSGGVDSSVVAYLLKKQGYDVIGVFLKFWTPPVSVCGTARENACCDMKALMLARQVSGQLNIPLYTINVSSYFKKEIVDYFISEYESGRTPNPCVLCNEKIKFGVLWKKAKALGAEYLATGHYVRIRKDNRYSIIDIKEKKNKNIQYLPAGRQGPVSNISLYRSRDTHKDQTYFLSGIDKAIIPHLLFPLGNMVKSDVREIAKKVKLPVYNKKDSTGICFVPDGDTSTFLSYYSKKLNKPGDIVDKYGNKLGRHEGLMGHTLGERMGSEISNIQYPISNQCPMPNTQSRKDIPRLYVTKIDVKKNQLVIGENPDCFTDTLIAEDVNVIDNDLFSDKTILAQIRGGHKPEKCKIDPSLSGSRQKSLSLVKERERKRSVSRVRCVFAHPVRAITPGQTVAFYSLKGKLFGGGTIV